MKVKSKPKIKVLVPFATDDDDIEEIVINNSENFVELPSKTNYQDDLPEIEGLEIISDCLKKLKKRDPKAKISKEELIEECETQIDNLIKNESKYRVGEYNLKLKRMQTALSNLRVEFVKTNVSEWNKFTETIDNIIKKKKIPQKQFDSKIDLSRDPNKKKDDRDPTYIVLTSSRKYFDKMGYEIPPPQIAKLDPKLEHNKRQGFGNQAMPNDLLKRFNFG